MIKFIKIDSLYNMYSYNIVFDKDPNILILTGPNGFGKTTILQIIQFGKLKNGLIKCRDYIFNFLENPAIPPDNNASERGIRKVKIKMKNSGTFRSDKGADAFLDLLSIVETTKKHNNSPYAAIRALF